MSDKIFIDNLLSRHVALVTGGGTGITGGVARALAESGARVALVSRKLEHLEPAVEKIRASGGEAIACAADVRNFEEVEGAIAATIEKFGQLDIVVNGAAGNFLCAAEELSPNGFGTVVDIDLKGTFNTSRAAFAELDGLKRALGRSTFTALQSLLPFSRNDQWEVAELRQRLARR